MCGLFTESARVALHPFHTSRDYLHTRSYAYGIGPAISEISYLCLRRNPPLVSLRNEPTPLKGFLIVVAMFFGTLRQFHFLPGHLFVWNHAQKMRDAIQAGLAFII